MLLPDVNILVYFFRKDSPNHRAIRSRCEEMMRGPEPFATADIVLSGFIRVVTHPHALNPPTPPDQALDFVEKIRSQFVNIAPGPRHWGIFMHLCQTTDAKGNLVPDAYLAALAIEHGCEWISTDRGFARFPGLRWRHPLD